jgi:hypothetical protein
VGGALKQFHVVAELIHLAAEQVVQARVVRPVMVMMSPVPLAASASKKISSFV